VVYFAIAATEFFELLGSQDKRPFLNSHRAPKPERLGARTVAV
jgi:hypothetical protein